MSNETLIDLARASLPNTVGSELKWACAMAEFALLFICGPLIILNRNKPVIYFRCWSLNLMTVVLLATYKTCGAILATPSLVSFENYGPLRVAGLICLYGSLASFHATFIRHYYLLQRPKLQQLLAASSPLEPQKYLELTKRYSWAKFLSTEKAAWSYWLLNCVMVWTVQLSALPSFDVAKSILGNGSTFDFLSSIIMALEPITAIILLLLLIPVKSMDNYHITLQLQVLTFVSAIIVILAIIIMVAPRSQFTINLELVNDTILPLIVIAINLIVPVWPEKVLKRSVSIRSNKNISSSSQTIGSNSGMALSSTARARRPPRTDLDYFLENSHELERLKKFMVKEICLENLLFVLAVSDYRREVDAGNREKMIAKAKVILTDFIEPSALNEVNIPVGCSRNVRAAVKELIEGSSDDAEGVGAEFDDADQHIRQLILTDTLRRFNLATGRTPYDRKNSSLPKELTKVTIK